MTSLPRRSLASVVIAAGLLLAGGTATANADILDALADEYGRSASGGQVPNLVDDALTLRARGARPTAANVAAIKEALDKRPNLIPLADALRNTVAQQQQQIARGGGSGGGVPAPPGSGASPWSPGDYDDVNPQIPSNWGSGINGW